ncbi:protein NLRC3-like isoform X2 [Cyprinodon tularosa]|nr:protein NLRC3-like isoform X2 [Cyprinodon tularosa]XP_038142498.1 protein NLRC3-like isoform X2 [Cyprinodon tularosa]
MSHCKDKDEEELPCAKPSGEERSGVKRTELLQKDINPGSSSASCNSAGSKDIISNFKERKHMTELLQKDINPGSSSASCNSAGSKDIISNFKERKHMVQEQSAEAGQSPPQHQNELDSVFQDLEDSIVTFVKNKLKVIKSCMSTGKLKSFESDGEDESLPEDTRQRRSCMEALVKIALHFLRAQKQEELADQLESKCSYAILQEKHKFLLKRKFQYVFEGIAKSGHQTLLNQIFTELYLTDGGNESHDNQHEIGLIATASRAQNKPEMKIKCEDIFKTTKMNKPVRTVMTKGVAGIGKTVLTQKFTLDWAENKTNQKIHYIFPFTFRELNFLQGKELSLVELIKHFFTDCKDLGNYRFEDICVAFIFDGLDECQLPLDFFSNKILTDVTESASLDVLLTNLIRGNLLPSAYLWITTRPAAASQIPLECVDLVTEVRGFAEQQMWEEYFRKRFTDEDLASNVISQIKTSRTLRIMCQIPVFCWITATVLENDFKTCETKELPKTRTELYIHYLLIQAKLKLIKCDKVPETQQHWSLETRGMIEILGKLAFNQLQKGNLIFYESDLENSGINIHDASKYAEDFPQMFIEDKGLYQGKVFSFVHLSVQEFLAALHVHLTFFNCGINLLGKSDSEEATEAGFYKTAVKETLQSRNGHLDQFLCFLLGLSLKSNKTLLQGLLMKTDSNPEACNETIKHIRDKISENLPTEKGLNLFYCLNELGDNFLVEEIQQYLSSGRLCTDKLSPAHWSALVFNLLSSEEYLDVFDLKKYSASEEALMRLLQVVKAASKVLLDSFQFSEKSLTALASIISSKDSNMSELEISNTRLQDSGVQLLMDGVEPESCKMESLRFSLCNLSEKCCKTLSRLLSSNLRALDLSNNDIRDSGLKRLSDGLKSPNCRLEILRLSGCLITENGCDSLLSALNRSSHLRELDLSYNHPGDSAVKGLTAIQEDPEWKLETLILKFGGNKWLRPGLKKYSCTLTFDTDTINRGIELSENNMKVTYSAKLQPYNDHHKRFEYWCPQLLCSEGVSGRGYWEVDWSGRVYIAVSYREIERCGGLKDCLFGWNKQSWALVCCEDGYSVWHDDRMTPISSSSISHRVAVYVDLPAGILSFYKVSSETLIHIHTFSTTFTGSLFPGFGFWSGWPCSSVCMLASCC